MPIGIAIIFRLYHEPHLQLPAFVANRLRHNELTRIRKHIQVDRDIHAKQAERIHNCLNRLVIQIFIESDIGTGCGTSYDRFIQSIKSNQIVPKTGPIGAN